MPFDPYDLPDDPVVAIDISVDSTGRETATVDGRPVEPDAGESARAAAVRTVAEFVDRLPGSGAGGRARAGVRARINGPGFRDYDVAVDREGRLYVPIGPPPVAAPRTVPRPAEGAVGLGTATSAAATATVERPAGHAVAPPLAGPGGAAPRRDGPPRPGSPGVGPGDVGRGAGPRPGQGAAPVWPPRGGDPTDSRATGTRPTGTRPTDAHPTGTHPTGTHPTGANPSDDDARRGGSGRSGGWSSTFLDDRPSSMRTGAAEQARGSVGAAAGPVAVAASGLASLGRMRGPAPHDPSDHQAPPDHHVPPHHPVPPDDPGAAEHTVRISPVIPADRLAGLVRATRDQRAAASARDPRAAATDAGEAAARDGRDGTRPRRVRPAVVAVVVAAVLVVAALAVIARMVLHPRDTRGSEASAAASDRPFPGAVAPGWAVQPRWVSAAVEAGGGRVLAFGDTVAYVTAQHRLVAVDATSGVTRWHVPLPAGTMRDGLAHTTIDGRAVVAAHIDDTLAWWSAADGQNAGSLALPAGSRTTFLGAAPLVGVDDRTVALVRGNTLRRLALPTGAFALAASERGQVTAASGRGWWHLRPGVAAGAPRGWETAAPDDEAPRAAPVVVGYLGDAILTVYPPDRTGRRHVVASTDAPQVRVSFRGAITTPAGTTAAAGLPWWPSPSGTWGVLGRTIVDLERGAVRDLGDWTTTWITTDRAYGTIDGRPVQVGPEVPRADVGADITIPEIVTPAGAVFRARADDGERLYLLPPT